MKHFKRQCFQNPQNRDTELLHQINFALRSLSCYTGYEGAVITLLRDTEIS